MFNLKKKFLFGVRLLQLHAGLKLPVDKALTKLNFSKKSEKPSPVTFVHMSSLRWFLPL